LTKGLATDDEKIHALYNFVSLKFHYIGLDFGIGRYQPHAADDVLDNGYGDCKDKHTLLAALLKAEGIEAWPALIHGQRKLDPEVPSPAQFDHVITVVPRGGQFLWLDTTPEVAPYRLLLQPLRNKQALVVPTNEPPKLMTTPANPPQPQRQEFSMAGKLDAHGTFKGHAEQIYEGDVEVALRMAFRQVPESQWKEAVQRFSRGLNFGGDVSDVKVTPPDELDKPLQISYDYERKNYGDWEHNQTMAPLPPIGLESSKDAKIKKPLEPVLLGALGKVSYRSRLELPKGYHAVAPVPVHLVEPYAAYESQTNTEDGVMTTTRVLTIKQNEVPLSEWEAFRKFGQVIYDDEFNFWTLDGRGTTAARDKGDKDAEDESDDENNDKDADLRTADLGTLLSDGESAMRQRNFQRAQELFELVIKKDPNYRGAHFDLGIALASRGTTTDAMEEFRKEEKISPSDPRPYQVVAAYLTQTGNRNEAIEEWRKLVHVDPQNRTAVARLAGMLYESEKYSEAVAVLEPAVKASPDSSSLQDQLGSAYAKNGQHDKALAMFKQLLEQKGDDPSTLNDVAWTLAENKISLDVAQQWAEKAVRLLEEQAHGAESSDDAALRVTFQLSLTWDTLGWVYFQQGDSKRAEPLVKAAWLLGEDSVVAKHLGEIYAKEGKTQMAAKAYLNALAVSPAATGSTNMGSFMMGAQNEVQKAQQKEADEIQGRYEKLTGKKPELRTSVRLPNGEWTLTPAEQLRRSREVKLTNEGKLSGKAQFTVVLKPGKVESAERSSGDPVLDSLSDKLEAAHYPVEFPPDSAAILVLRVEVTCETAACIGRLENPVPPRPQSTAPSY
jgi:tetratricopeptide (TPR) repeat protein